MKTILVVDDEPILNSAYCALLNNSGYNAIGALNATEGLLMLKKQTPDAVLLDLNMPEIDGIGFLEQSKIAEEHPETKVIIFTVSDDDARIDKAFSLGANRYILKVMLAPTDLEKIIREELGD